MVSALCIYLDTLTSTAFFFKKVLKDEKKNAIGKIFSLQMFQDLSCDVIIAPGQRHCIVHLVLF